MSLPRPKADAGSRNNRRLTGNTTFMQQHLCQIFFAGTPWFPKGKLAHRVFKLHLVINHQAEIVAFRLTAGNIDDRKPVPEMVTGMYGKAFADRGYISEKLSNHLITKNIQLITKVKKNMKNKLILLIDKIMLRKRAIIESVINILKSGCQIEHQRHRSRYNFLSNLMAGLAAYCLNPNKPRLFFNRKEIEQTMLLT